MNFIVKTCVDCGKEFYYEESPSCKLCLIRWESMAVDNATGVTSTTPLEKEKQG